MDFEGLHSREHGQRTEDGEDRGSPFLCFAVTKDEVVDGHHLHSTLTNYTPIAA